MKRIIRTAHLYLALVSGSLLLLACLTGGVLAFEKQWEQTLHPERYFVAVSAGATRLPLAQLLDRARRPYPRQRVASLTVWADPARTVEVGLASKPEAKGPARSREGGRGKKGDGGPRLYLNPYTGAVTGEYRADAAFFHQVERLHRGLVAGPVGQQVMGLNALALLLSLGTGLVLGWPGSRRLARARLRPTWGRTWAARAYTLHVSGGLYAALLLLVLAGTGAGMAFDWVGQGINWLTHSPARPAEPPTSIPAAPGAVSFSPDAALALAQRHTPDARFYRLQLPADPASSLRVAARRPQAPADNATDDLYLDQFTGQVLRAQTYADRPLGQRVRGLFKPLHTGVLLGVPGQALALLGALLGLTFPITGAVLWRQRRRRERAATLRPRAAQLA